MAENPCRGIRVESAKERRPPTILRISELRKLLALAKGGFKVEAAEEEKTAWRKKFGSDFNSRSANGHGTYSCGRLLRRRAS